MHQDSGETAIEMITMEEYLKRRQAIRQQDAVSGAELALETASALMIADILYI